MSSKIKKEVKNADITSKEADTEKKETWYEKHKLVIRIISAIVVGIIAMLKLGIMPDKNIEYIIGLDRTIKITIMVTSVIIWIAIALICGSYQSKVQNEKINISTVLKEENEYKRNTDIKTRIKNKVSFLILQIIFIEIALMLSETANLGFMVITLFGIIIMEPIKKFKTVDVLYTIYFIGMLGYIVKGLL